MRTFTPFRRQHAIGGGLGARSFGAGHRLADPFSAEQAVRMGGVVFRPIRQKLTYVVAVAATCQEELSREALKFFDLFRQQLQRHVDVDKVEQMSAKTT